MHQASVVFPAPGCTLIKNLHSDTVSTRRAPLSDANSRNVTWQTGKNNNTHPHTPPPHTHTQGQPEGLICYFKGEKVYKFQIKGKFTFFLVIV